MNRLLGIIDDCRNCHYCFHGYAKDGEGIVTYGLRCRLTFETIVTEKEGIYSKYIPIPDFCPLPETDMDVINTKKIFF